MILGYPDRQTPCENKQGNHHPAIICLKLTIETQGVKYVQS